MQTLYVTEAVMRYRKNYLNTTEYYDVSEYANIVKNYIIYFYSLNSSSVSVISIKKTDCP